MSLTSRTLSWSKDAQKTSGGWLVSDRSVVKNEFFKWFLEVSRGISLFQDILRSQKNKCNWLLQLPLR